MNLWNKIESTCLIAILGTFVGLTAWNIHQATATMAHMAATMDAIQYDLTVIGIHDNATKKKKSRH